VPRNLARTYLTTSSVLHGPSLRGGPEARKHGRSPSVGTCCAGTPGWKGKRGESGQAAGARDLRARCGCRARECTMKAYRGGPRTAGHGLRIGPGPVRAHHQRSVARRPPILLATGGRGVDPGLQSTSEDGRPASRIGPAQEPREVEERGRCANLSWGFPSEPRMRRVSASGPGGSRCGFECSAWCFCPSRP
jgi:hypothetical protein